MKTDIGSYPISCHLLPLHLMICSGYPRKSGAVLTWRGVIGYELSNYRRTAGRISPLSVKYRGAEHRRGGLRKPGDATEIIAALKEERNIVAACLYNRQGKCSLRYPEAARKFIFPQCGADGCRFVGGELVGFTPRAGEGQRALGPLYIRSDMGAMDGGCASTADRVLVIAISLTVA